MKFHVLECLFGCAFGAVSHLTAAVRNLVLSNNLTFVNPPESEEQAAGVSRSCYYEQW